MTPYTKQPAPGIMMKSAFIASLFVLLNVPAYSQYYYQDLLTLDMARKKQELFRTLNVKMVKSQSYDEGGQPLAAFHSSQQVSRDSREVVTRTSSPLGLQSVRYAWYSAGSFLQKTADSMDGSATVITYQYEGGRISRIESLSRSPGNVVLTETHQWQYTEEGKPRLLYVIKNGGDTTSLSFVMDEKGRVVEEKGLRNGKPTTGYYYYYDEQDRLTDIVHYQVSAKKLLPDFIFEYDENGRLGSMMVVPEGSSDYQKWYYSYDEDGLKLLDACYSRQKQLMGRVEYTYGYY